MKNADRDKRDKELRAIFANAEHLILPQFKKTENAKIKAVWNIVFPIVVAAIKNGFELNEDFDFFEKRRSFTLAVPRHFFRYFMYNISFTQEFTALHDKSNHATILHSCKVVCNLRDTNINYKNLYETIKAEILEKIPPAPANNCPGENKKEEKLFDMNITIKQVNKITAREFYKAINTLAVSNQQSPQFREQCKKILAELKNNDAFIEQA